MSVKIVYQTDENGIYLEEGVAYESPLEPGCFLIPAGATEIPPPPVKENQYAKLVDGKWEVCEYEEIPKEEIWKSIRAYRNSLLASCDWTQLQDSPLSAEIKQKWIEYRQALRDIPQNFIEFDDIIWPSAP